MKICCVCRNKITNAVPAILFIDRAGADKEICSVCEKSYGILMESENADELKEAINYLYTCLLSASDDEVAKFLKETIDNNSSAITEIETRRIKSEPVDMEKKQNYFLNGQSEAAYRKGGSFWISGMRIFAWILFGSIIVGGIILAFQIGHAGVGFLVVLGSLVAAFLSVALIMIFLDMACDIAEINSRITD